MKEIGNVKSIRDLDNDFYVAYCNTIKQGTLYRFSTVEYDNQMFRDYVIDQTIYNGNDIDTVSKKRIANAFDFFCDKLKNKTEKELLLLLNAIIHASCTTHVVKDESEAVQMFIFQNNRGKKPTNLEIIKAQFMYNLHLYAPVEDKQHLLAEITERFEHIYKSIAKIEENINEDNVLNYTIKVYRNSLDNVSSRDFVNEQLDKSNSSVAFIQEFTCLLSSCFSQISNFLDEEKRNITYHSLLVSTADRSIVLPFIIKALLKRMPHEEIEELARALERIFLRHRIIGTRANLVWRLNEWAYQKMDKSVKPAVNQIKWMMKAGDGWWRYWNDDELLRALNMEMNHQTAKVLLWKYENHLIQCGKVGYKLLRYDDIKQPHLEHIAPQTENQEPDNGYCHYDDDFRNQYLERLGNYLLLSGSHNMSLSNSKFQIKRNSYKYLLQQLEVQKMTEQDQLWGKDEIHQRHKKIVDYLMQIL